jgi:hypothetical protein
MARADRLGLIVLSAVWVTLFGGLVVVGISSWRRTAPLRLGGPQPPPRAMRTLSSPSTRLAGATGGAAFLWGLLVVRSGRPLGAVAGLWGAVVAVSGVRSRVTGLSVDRDGFVVRYASRGPFSMAWNDWVTLRPPRWPLGGWVLVGRAGRRTLMPSDLWGQEQSLGSIVGFAGLRFDGRAWVRGP